MKALPIFLPLLAALSLAAATNLQGAVTPVLLPRLLNTWTNPTPEAYDKFGYPVVAMGTDRVLIGSTSDDAGATNAGAVYLYCTNGTLLNIFTNPTATAYGDFGMSVAVVGTDRLLIGAPSNNKGATTSGAAYLFGTNGTMVTTFTNPTPKSSDLFGNSVAAVGADRVLVGAMWDGTGAANAGAAYLFSTNGTLLTTFTNPAPAENDEFGYSTAAVGSDRVLIGVFRRNTMRPGAAYLFDTNGALLVTFANPTQAGDDHFGLAVAALGTDRVLIGSLFRNTGANSFTGAAYLFGTNGTLLNMITNPTPPTTFDDFGSSVAAVGTDRLLIGAYRDNTGATMAGAAYLFSTNGALLTAFTNPTPSIFGNFGSSVMALGSDRVLIGAHGYNPGVPYAGAAYLYSLEPLTPPAPSLSTSRNPSLSTLTISWPAPAEGWLLEGTNALPSVAVASWPPVLPPYRTNAGTISVTLTNLPATGNQFFRLRQP